MSSQWTTQQVIALAPDASSAKAGRDLSLPREWIGLGQSARAIWGEHQGSGKEPYRAGVDLHGPAFKCSCPSRKSPCKHGLGLFLAFVESVASFAVKAPPGWLDAWLAERDQKSETKSQARHHAEPAAPSPDPEAQAERARKREARVAEGLEELGLWLRDLVRQGLAGVVVERAAFFESMAARLVDAQAPGAARWVQRLRDLCGAGQGRERRILEHVARLHLLVEGRRRLHSLAPESQADVRSTIGWTVSSDDLLMQPGVASTWSVLGRRVETEDRLRAQRTWLWSHELGQPALLLDFAVGARPFEVSFSPGTWVDIELVFYPGSVRMRALEKSRRSTPSDSTPSLQELGFSIRESVDRAARAVARNPWLERHPMSLRSVVPARRAEAWALFCEDGSALPISSRFRSSWELLALSGGRSLGVFGEWDGYEVLPLSAWTPDGFWDFSPGQEE